MNRHQVARLALAGVITVTVLLGLGTVGRLAYVDRQPAAVATMAVLLALFAVAVVVWAMSSPAAGESAAEVTTQLGTVGAEHWPNGDIVGAVASLQAFVAGDGRLIEHGEVTEPRLFTHEFEPASRLTDDGDVGAHWAGTPVRELLQREGFDGGLA